MNILEISFRACFDIKPFETVGWLPHFLRNFFLHPIFYLRICFPFTVEDFEYNTAKLPHNIGSSGVNNSLSLVLALQILVKFPIKKFILFSRFHAGG